MHALLQVLWSVSFVDSGVEMKEVKQARAAGFGHIKVPGVLLSSPAFSLFFPLHLPLVHQTPVELLGKEAITPLLFSK